MRFHVLHQRMRSESHRRRSLTPVSLRRGAAAAILGLHRREQNHLLRHHDKEHPRVLTTRARFPKIMGDRHHRERAHRPASHEHAMCGVRTRMCALPVSSMTSRSTPMPKPPVGGNPCSSATQKSSSLPCASASPRCWSYVATESSACAQTPSGQSPPEMPKG